MWTHVRRIEGGHRHRAERIGGADRYVADLVLYRGVAEVVQLDHHQGRLEDGLLVEDDLAVSISQVGNGVLRFPQVQACRGHHAASGVLQPNAKSPHGSRVERNQVGEDVVSPSRWFSRSLERIDCVHAHD